MFYYHCPELGFFIKHCTNIALIGRLCASLWISVLYKENDTLVGSGGDFQRNKVEEIGFP